MAVTDVGDILFFVNKKLYISFCVEQSIHNFLSDKIFESHSTICVFFYQQNGRKKSEK